MPGKIVFVSGATGYLGRHLIPQLLTLGHSVRALSRLGSEEKLPSGCEVITGDALNAATFRDSVMGADTYIHMVGVSHPSPSKAELFRTVDLKAVHASLDAAKWGNIAHLIYVSVAHPAPVMKAYVRTRIEAEEAIRTAGFNATILQPWYVLGPGHRWAYALLPLYWIWERRASSREMALRLGLVTLRQMIGALVYAVEHRASGIAILNVEAIRKLGSRQKVTQ